MTYKVVVLASGGLDSSTCLGKAVVEFQPKNVLALSVIYGQRHKKEIDAAITVSKHYGVQHEIINLPAHLFTGSDSPLVNDKVNMPHESYEDLRKSEGPSATYVPFRNSILISNGVALALSRGASYLYFGAHADDAHNWAYPDCTPEFIYAMQGAVRIGTYGKVDLVVPYMFNTKADIVMAAVGLSVPTNKTWSCYEGGDLHCGLCPTCVSRKEAFKILGDGRDKMYDVQYAA